MQFNKIAGTLACLSLALGAHYAFAGIQGNACLGKLCSSFNAGGGFITVTVEDLSRVEWDNVSISVQQCDSNGLNCATPQTQRVGTVAGGQKVSRRFSAPPTHVYFITINGTFNGQPTPIPYPGFLVQP